MFIAEIHLTHPVLALTHTIKTVPEMEIELEYQTITDTDNYQLFFKVAGEEFDTFEAAAREDPTVSDTAMILDGGTFRVYRMQLVETEQLVLPEAAHLGLRVLQAQAGEGGWIGKVQAPDNQRLQEFRSYCEQKDIEFTLKRIYETTDEGKGTAFGLTPRQREALLTAYQAGYFDEPRGASLQDIADQIGISSSSASGRLRRAINTLVAHTVAEDSG